MYICIKEKKIFRYDNNLVKICVMFVLLIIILKSKKNFLYSFIILILEEAMRVYCNFG